MPDITMCKGDDCIQKCNCYRYTAKPAPQRQSYFTEPPFNIDGCESYWDNRNKRYGK